LDVYKAAIVYAILEGESHKDTVLLKTANLLHDSRFIIQAEIVRYFRVILKQKFYLILTVVGTDSKNKRNNCGH
jgi:hypothetical protein